jgi:hypothetical protein
MRRPPSRDFSALVVVLGIFCTCLVSPAHATWFPDGVPLCTEPHDQTVAAIVSDGANGAIVVWQDRRFNEDIFAQRVDGSGVPLWTTNGLSVCSEMHQQSTATALSAPSHGAVVFWADHRSGSDDIYAQRIDGTGLSLWASNGIPIASTSDNEFRPLAISDGSSGTFAPVGCNVLWVSGAGTSSDLRANRVNADGALRSPASSGGVSLVSNIATPSAIAMAGDGIGNSVTGYGAVAAWSENRNGGAQGYDIYARRVNNSGTPQWAGGGVPVCDLNGDQQNPSMVNVGVSVIVAWDDLRSPDRNIWVQKLDSSGNALWLADGLPVCQFSGSQYDPKIVSDLAGGAIVVWTDVRSSPSKIYAQRLDANGQRLWTPADGIPLCTATGAQSYPAVVGDGAGGAIVAWQDGRNGSNNDLYAQRVDPSGNLMWGGNAAPLSRTLGNQQFAALATDGANGAIAAWTDYRGGVPDVFANRAFASGPVDVPVHGPTGFRLSFASSNPSLGNVKLLLDLPHPSLVRAEVMDLNGRQVRAMLSRSNLGAGTHSIAWDGRNDLGARMPPGVFFARVRVGTEVLSTRIVRLN